MGFKSGNHTVPIQAYVRLGKSQVFAKTNEGYFQVEDEGSAGNSICKIFTSKEKLRSRPWYSVRKDWVNKLLVALEAEDFDAGSILTIVFGG